MISLFVCLLVAPTVEGHWIALHDGETQFGWVTTSDADWTVDEGVLTVSGGEPGFLRTTTKFANFELQLDYRAPATTNSGVFLRMTDDPQDPTTDCYEVNIADNNPFPTGSLVARAKAVGPLPAVQPDAKSWRRLHVTADLGEIVVAIDGETMVRFHDPQPIRDGYIGLQLNQGPIEFRNIRLRPLRLRPLIGTDLSGWQSLPDGEGRFEIPAPATLRVVGGPGQLETETTFGNFILQTEARTHAVGLNSGIFFRCIPGDRMMGYESQIDHTIAEGTEDQPANCGTGGIFRRVDARRVVARDLEWFRKTIVAHEDHFAVWVNGYQVTDWTDTRAPDENPRRGLRLEPGSIILQAHDPTTDVEFRHLGVAEY